MRQKVNLREVVRVLILSPFYFRLTPAQRLVLVKDYRREINRPPVAPK